ncbi:MAG: ATP-grasp domain-containing protein [Candidatus Heimdallarchaeota archaeon]
MGLLLEFEGKEVYKEIGIPLLPGVVAKNIEEAIAAGDKLGYPVVVKGQILHGGRGKAGLIKVVKDKKELEEVTPAILIGTIKDMKVQNVLIEKAAKIANELYLSVMFDTYSREIVFIMSTEGGVDIEAVAKDTPDKVKKPRFPIDYNFTEKEASELAESLGFKGDELKQLVAILTKMWDALHTKDLQLIEINPLAVLDDGKIIALDSKVIIDDNAIYRHPSYQKFMDERIYLTILLKTKQTVSMLLL